MVTVLFPGWKTRGTTPIFVDCARSYARKLDCTLFYPLSKHSILSSRCPRIYSVLPRLPLFAVR